MEIPKGDALVQRVFSIADHQEFEKVALDTFRFQYYSNSVYQAYCNLLKCSPAHVAQVAAIPYLPISFFKTHAPVSTGFRPEAVFESSGTTGMHSSRHPVKDLRVYETAFHTAFERAYGPPHQYCILGLLPSYLERGNSSLVYMVEHLIRGSRHPLSGFYLDDFDRLSATLRQLEAAGQRALLIGVTYALLDFAERHPAPLRHTLIMETGGMKGRKRELVRSEVHAVLQKAFGLSCIHSEYGMTELLSQGYAGQEGRFRLPPWARVVIREEDDPLSAAALHRTGGINIIDLANVYSCAFLATEDLGRLHEDGSFEVLGRLDHAEIRGCSLLAL